MAATKIRQIRIARANTADEQWEVSVSKWWQDAFGVSHREVVTKKYPTLLAAVRQVELAVRQEIQP